MPAEPSSPAPSAEWLIGTEAAAYARLSLKSLTRADAAGEEVGLRRVGRKLLFNRDLLSKWLLGQKSATAAPPVPNIRLAHTAR